MKYFFKYILILTLIISCDSEDAGDCFQTAGKMIQQEISVESFEKIIINERISLIIKEGPIQKIVIETGENLINDIKIEVSNNQFTASNHNKCNFVRDYELTKIFITAPNITEIRNSSNLKVISDGILTYPSLNLISEDYLLDYLNVGDFNIEVNNTTTRIVSNGISNFYIHGTTTNLNIFFAAGDSRFEGKTLIATNVQVTNKSSNDILVNPQNKIEGAIFSLGNVIAFNRPTIINVIEHYKGKLIFK